MEKFYRYQENILNFWFGTVDSPEYGKYRQEWFTKNPDFDREVRERFFSVYQLASVGRLSSWESSPLGCLALLLVLDQFPRNMFRNTMASFATDQQALNLAKYAVSQGFDWQLLPVQRWFIYLPFEHSEHIEDQSVSVRLFSHLIDDSDSKVAINSALFHEEIIKDFGRFPHRNKILGRVNTPEEEEFLRQHPSYF
jgi:uncharacterized protein (DUF924 family)